MTLRTIHIPWTTYSKPIKSQRTAETLAHVIVKHVRSVRVKKEGGAYQIYVRERGNA